MCNYDCILDLKQTSNCKVTMAIMATIRKFYVGLYLLYHINVKLLEYDNYIVVMRMQLFLRNIYFEYLGVKSIVMSSIYFHLIKVQERERNRQNGGVM